MVFSLPYFIDTSSDGEASWSAMYVTTARSHQHHTDSVLEGSSIIHHPSPISFPLKPSTAGNPDANASSAVVALARGDSSRGMVAHALTTDPTSFPASQLPTHRVVSFAGIAALLLSLRLRGAAILCGSDTACCAALRCTTGTGTGTRGREEACFSFLFFAAARQLVLLRTAPHIIIIIISPLAPGHPRHKSLF